GGGRGAGAGSFEVDVEDPGLHTARHRRERGEQRRALARYDVLESQPAGADLGEVVIEPIGERGVEIRDAAIAFGREKTGRRMVEVIDRLLQLLEDVLVPLELTRHIRERPDPQPGYVLRLP